MPPLQRGPKLDSVPDTGDRKGRPYDVSPQIHGATRPTGGAEPSGSPQEPVPDRPAGSRLTFRDTAGGASPSPTVLKKLFRDWVGEALGPPAVDDSAKRSPSSAPFVGTCPYPLCRCATSSLPLLAFGHFPLTGGIVPLIRGVGPLGGGRLDGRLIAAPTVDTEAGPSSVGAGPRPARNYGPAITCSAKPGAVVEPHQRKFLQTQGPVARNKTIKATQILRAGNTLLTHRYASPVMGDRGPTPLVKGRWPKARGDREGEYGHKVSILSCPPAILWFLSHRWERNSPRRAKPSCNRRKGSITAPSSAPLRGHLPPRGKA